MSETKGLLHTVSVGDGPEHLAIAVTEDGLSMSLLTVCHEGRTAFAGVYEDDDARRLVACWNACDGMETEVLEAAPGYQAAIRGFHEQRSLVVKARNERDQLLAACKSVVDAFDAFPPCHPARSSRLGINSLREAMAQIESAQ